jgi:restriction system protein
MALWMVRAGRNGEQEEGALEHGVVSIGWNELPDLSSIRSRDELRALYEEYYPTETKMKVANAVGQIWAFISRIQTDDLAAIPLKTRSAFAIGRVKGPYQYRTDLRPNILHTRPVEWIQTDLPRTAFEQDQDLLYSFGAIMTVCQIKRNDAERRVRAILEGQRIAWAPGAEEDEGVEEVDVEQVARDQILGHISTHFKGHALARLVDAVLQGQGYVTRVSEPGPDGGVDILAGAGPMGFDQPRLCVQVKSSESRADVNVLRSLQGTIGNFGAQQGLLVSWGGFTAPTLEEARHAFFAVRLWDSDGLIEAVLRNYDALPESVQAELPLKRIWALVLEEG